MVVVGADVHKRTHMFVAVDQHTVPSNDVCPTSYTGRSSAINADPFLKPLDTHRRYQVTPAGPSHLMPTERMNANPKAAARYEPDAS